MEVWSWCIVDKNASPEVKDRQRLGNLRGQCGPGSTLEADDGENWNMCTASTKGIVARQYTFNYQLGLGHERSDGIIPGSIIDGVSEQNQRGFYEYWSEMINAESWADLR